MTTITSYFTSGHEPTAAEMLSIARITNITGNWTNSINSTVSTGLGSYQNIGLSANWTKDGSSSQSNVLLMLWASFRVSATPSALWFGIQLGSTDYDVVRMEKTSTSGDHIGCAGFRLVTGVAAGVYTPQLRFWRPEGTGNPTFDNNDVFSFIVAEVPISS